MIDMTNDDIVERLRALSRCEHSDLSIGDEAAAEIVRLRGEVAERADDLTTAYMAGRFDAKAPAPAEAKGDACNCPGGYKRDPEKHAPNCPVRTLPCRTLANPFDTPQPAGGEAVAEVGPGWTLRFVGATPIAELCRQHPELHIGTKLYTHPAAQAPAVRVNDVLLRVSDEDLRWCKDTIAALQEAGGPTNNMRAVGLSRLIAALEAALGQESGS